MCQMKKPRSESQDGMNAGENQIVVYQPNETVRLDVRLENETVWLTQEQIANLFGTKRPAITKHLANIYKSGELEREGTCSILEHMGNDGKQSYRTMFYNLDAILSVGYRVNSRNATLFRRWATQVLKTYLLKGYAVNARLSQLEDKVDRRLAKHDDRLATLEQKVDFFVQTKELPLQSIPRFVTEALACREQVIAKSNRQSRGFNYALNFLNPIAEYDTPKMRDKTLLARYIDMIA